MSFFSNVTYHAPAASNVNSIAFAVNGTGAPGIYNSSTTPDAIYGTYNWCNMPHARTREYPLAPRGYRLKYVEVIHRHHKRTPYSSNILPTGEEILWDCPEEGPLVYIQNRDDSQQVRPVRWAASTDAQNPFTTMVGFNGSTCQFPQITAQGLQDSYQHGEDLANLYRTKLGFLPDTYDSNRIKYRVTNNVITSQVAGGLIQAMFPSSRPATVEIQAGSFRPGLPDPLTSARQADSFDSLEPTYSCPTADNVLAGYQGSGTPWADHLKQAAPIFEKLDAVAGIPSNDSTGFHASFDHYYDNLSAKQCHGYPLPCSLQNRALCIDQATADAVYRLGNWEYSYNWRDANQSTLYSAGHYGAYLLELRGRIAASVDGSSAVLYQHNVAHDGSISPLLGALQVSTGFWPGMGTEIIFELYEGPTKGDHAVRVLLSGQVMNTSTPLGLLSMVPWPSFESYLTSLVGSTPSALYKYCNP